MQGVTAEHSLPEAEVDEGVGHQHVQKELHAPDASEVLQTREVKNGNENYDKRCVTKCTTSYVKEFN
jgi:hypothetical protein